MKITIITVVLNAEELIEKTIKSVLDQDYHDLEYIIIDGMSTDKTPSIIQRYESQLAYWTSEADGGIYDAMNKAIDKATGEIVAFMNAGDWYEKNAFEKVERYFEGHPETDIVYGQVNGISLGKVVSVMGYYDPANPEMTYVRNMCHQGMFIKRKLFNTIGKFNLKYSVLADWDWNLRAVEKNTNIALLGEVVSNYLVGGISARQNDFLDEPLLILENLKKHKPICMDMKRILQQRKAMCECRLMVSKFPQKIAELWDEKKTYYIWGAGVVGEQCYELLKYSNNSIKGFLDINSCRTEYQGVKIFHCLEEIMDDLMKKEGTVQIILATPKYEKEMIQTLINHEVPKSLYMTYMELCEVAATFFKAVLDI